MAQTITPWPFAPLHDNLLTYKILPNKVPEPEDIEQEKRGIFPEDLAMTEEWMNFMQSMTNTLTTNFRPTGYTVPAITTTTAAQVAPTTVQSIVYNSDEESMQINNSGVWENIVTMLPLTAAEISNFTPTNDIKIHLLYNTDTDEIVVIRGETTFTLSKV